MAIEISEEEGEVLGYLTQQKAPGPLDSLIKQILEDYYFKHRHDPDYLHPKPGQGHQIIPRQVLRVLKDAKKDAQSILHVIESGTLPEFAKLPRVSGLAAILLLALERDDVAVKAHTLARDYVSAQARDAVNVRHDKKGGSRDKQNAIREAWASGKYSTRDQCAEEECDALGMKFSTARRALRNTPDPTTRGHGHSG